MSGNGEHSWKYIHKFYNFLALKSSLFVTVAAPRLNIGSAIGLKIYF
jgi:hypothetical protein